MIHFFSNHKDTSFVTEMTGEEVALIPHPLIEAEWTVEEIKSYCLKEITQAVDAEKLVLNGDYTIVHIISHERSRLGKQTWYISMKKLSEPGWEGQKDENGNIVHRNVLRPVAIRKCD